MDTRTDAELVSLIKFDPENSSQYISELSNKHAALINDVYGKYRASLSQSGVCLTDIYSEKLNLVYDAAITFEPAKKTKYSTHLFNKLRWQCLNASKSKSVENRRYNSKFQYILKNLKNDTTDSSFLIDEIEQFIYNTIKDVKERNIILQRFFLPSKSDRKWKNVALAAGLSSQQCINITNKWLSTIKQYLYERGIQCRDGN